MKHKATAGEGKRTSPPWRIWSVLALLVLVGLGYEDDVAASSYEDIPADHEPISPIPAPPLADARKLALGDRLFHDPRLSGDGSRACSSCHDIQTNGAEALRSEMARGGAGHSFNTNTVFNAALSFRLNWEGNARTLEDQAVMSLSDPSLMGSSVASALRSVQSNKELAHQFESAYGHGPDRHSLLDAIATYEQSLLTPGSPFDHWLQGDNRALSPEEQAGYQLFKSFGCVSCHQGVNVGGNLFERAGIFHKLGSSRGLLLRVPSLRNVAVMAPYFHDGSAPTLAAAVSEMGYAQLDRTLSNDQVKAIVAFLNSLTGSYDGRSLTASR